MNPVHKTPIPHQESEFLQCRSCGQDRPAREFTSGRRVCTPCRSRYKQSRIKATRNSIEEYAAVLMWRVRDRAKKRPYGPPTLSAGWIVQQWDRQLGRCFYSGTPMSLQPGPCLVTVERLNVNDGYTPENCVLACFCVNMMRGSVPIPEFKWWCEQIAQNAAVEPRAPQNKS